MSAPQSGFSRVWVGVVALVTIGAFAFPLRADDRRGEDRIHQLEEQIEQSAGERDELVERAGQLERELEELPDDAVEDADHLRAEHEAVERHIHELERHIERGREELDAARGEQRVIEIRTRIRDLRERGEIDVAERLEQQARRMITRFRFERGDEPQGDPHAARDEHAEVERRLHHLRVAIDNLRAAGMQEAAERLAHRAEQLKAEFRERIAEALRDRSVAARQDPPRGETVPERVAHHIEELHQRIGQMQDQMHELREKMHRVLERVEELEVVVDRMRERADDEE